MFSEVRELILHKCVPEKAQQPIREIFGREPFGALERLVTQKLLDVSQRVTRQASPDETWLRQLAQVTDRRYEQMPAMVIEFLETNVFTVPPDHCVTFLGPLIESWNVDLAAFGMEIVLNPNLVPEHPNKIEFAFVEREAAALVGEEPGLQAFLQDPSLCGDATAEENRVSQVTESAGTTADAPLLLP